MEETDKAVADTSISAVPWWSAAWDDSEEAFEAEDAVGDPTAVAASVSVSAFLVFLGVAKAVPDGFFVVGAVFLSLDPVDKVSFLVLVLPGVAEDGSPEAVARVPVVPVVRLTVVPSAYKYRFVNNK